MSEVSKSCCLKLAGHIGLPYSCSDFYCEHLPAKQFLLWILKNSSSMVVLISTCWQTCPYRLQGDAEVFAAIPVVCLSMRFAKTHHRSWIKIKAYGWQHWVGCGKSDFERLWTFICFLRAQFLLFHGGDELQELEVVEDSVTASACASACLSSCVPQPAFQTDRQVCVLCEHCAEVDHAHFPVPLKEGEGPQPICSAAFLPISPNVPNCSSSALLAEQGL